MINKFIKLVSIRDAYQWASELGTDSDEESERVGDYVWSHKPFPDCSYDEFVAANPDFEDAEKYCMILSGELV